MQQKSCRCLLPFEHNARTWQTVAVMISPWNNRTWVCGLPGTEHMIVNCGVKSLKRQRSCRGTLHDDNESKSGVCRIKEQRWNAAPTTPNFGVSLAGTVNGCSLTCRDLSNLLADVSYDETVDKINFTSSQNALKLTFRNIEFSKKNFPQLIAPYSASRVGEGDRNGRKIKKWRRGKMGIAHQLEFRLKSCSAIGRPFRGPIIEKGRNSEGLSPHKPD